MGFCNQIIYLAEGFREKSSIRQVGRDPKGPIQNDNGVADHRCTDQHDAEALLRREGRVSFLCGGGDAEAFQKIQGQRLCLFPGHVLVVLPDQSNVAPHGQIGYQRDLQRNQSKALMVIRQEKRQCPLQGLFIFEESQMNLTIDDSTSMVTMARKTLTIPFNTAIGILVSS